MYIPDRPGYKADEIGRVFSCRRVGKGGRRVWRPLSYWLARRKGGNGRPDRTFWCCYLDVGGGTHSKNTFAVRDLVAEAFLGPKPDGHHLYSLDRNPLNHRLANLAYLTRSEAWARGLIGTGNKAAFYHCAITAEQATAIRADYHDHGMYICDIARKWGHSPPLIRAVLTRKTWDKVPDGYPPLAAGGRHKPKDGLTAEDRLDIARQSVAGRHYSAIWREKFQGRVKEGRIKTLWYEARKKAGLVKAQPRSARPSSTTADSTTRPLGSSDSSPPVTDTTTSSTPAAGD
jgi:hypothetical protein